MEEWLYGKENPSYPANWDGLYGLLSDAEAHIAANLLKNAVICAIHPPPCEELAGILIHCLLIIN